MYVVCSKVNIITNFTRIHTFYFYNNKHIYQYEHNIYYKTHKFYQNQQKSRDGT